MAEELRMALLDVLRQGRRGVADFLHEGVRVLTQAVSSAQMKHLICLAHQMFRALLCSGRMASSRSLAQRGRVVMNQSHERYGYG